MSTVQRLVIELGLTPSYLSEMLRSLTGQNTQQQIHDRLIKRAKEILTTTDLTVIEIAHKLSFENPQSFNK